MKALAVTFIAGMVLPTLIWCAIIGTADCIREWRAKW